MTEEEIIQGNIQICHFMNPDKTQFINNNIQFQDFKYHTSFDWLMPVVEKISKLHSMDNLYKETAKVWEALMHVDINILWAAVVSFIKWYTKNKSEQ